MTCPLLLLSTHFCARECLLLFRDSRLKTTKALSMLSSSLAKKLSMVTGMNEAQLKRPTVSIQPLAHSQVHSLKQTCCIFTLKWKKSRSMHTKFTDMKRSIWRRTRTSQAGQLVPVALASNAPHAKKYANAHAQSGAAHAIGLVATYRAFAKRVNAAKGSQLKKPKILTSL